jgi:hypothetical protein
MNLFSCCSCCVVIDYSRAIKMRCPDFMAHPSRTIMTEFGKSLVLKTAGIVTRVEDKLAAPADAQLPVTAIVHAGKKNSLFICMSLLVLCELVHICCADLRQTNFDMFVSL